MLMRPIQISMPPELEKFAKEKAAANTESLAAYIRKLIIEDMKRDS